MDFTYIIFIFCLFGECFWLSKEEIFYNPFKTELESNLVDFKILYQSENAKFILASRTQELEVINDFVKFPHNSYLLSHSVFVFTDEKNNNYLFLEDGYYYFTISSDNEIETHQSKTSLSSDVLNIKFKDYIKLTKKSSYSKTENNICRIQECETIFFGKVEQYVYFYFRLDKKVFSINFGNVDEQISCKEIKPGILVCSFSENGLVKLKILSYVYSENSNKNSQTLKEIYNEEFIQYSNHDNSILYDTSDPEYKILCAREKVLNIIQCYLINFEATYDTYTPPSSFNIYINSIQNEYQTTFSNKENYCNITKYDTEYLICCQKSTYIICDRRDSKFEIIHRFNLSATGIISNLSLEFNGDYFKLLYNNEDPSESGIYEYRIYIPHCSNQSVVMNQYESSTINFNEMIPIATNSKYNILLKNLYNNIVDCFLNDVELKDFDIKYEFEGENNLLYIKSIKGYSSKKTFVYIAANEESYETACNVSMTIKACYESCKRCSENIEIANSESHYCIECKENYYPFLEGGTNCYTKDDVATNHQNWYFYEEKSIFDVCDSSCKTCYGASNENCLSCYKNENNELLYLYMGKCLLDCPGGTFKNESIEDYYICENCYINCLTCSSQGTASDMNCDSCSSDKIIYEDQCYEIIDSSIKRFINPEEPTEITSCHERHSAYIKEDSNTCISTVEEGYYISNTQTGLLSPCDSNCKSCTDASTHCTSCNEPLYLQESICVSSCSSKYYYSGSTCLKCHDNCLSCSAGKELDDSNKLISMKCEKCLDDESSEKTMIKNEENCFIILEYEENSIKFDISEINPDKEFGTCLDFNKAIFYNSYECITKPENTFYVVSTADNTGIIKYCHSSCDGCNGEGNYDDTNCINCTTGYFKTQDSDTNCLLESLIPPNYHKNDDGIYYKEEEENTDGASTDGISTGGVSTDASHESCGENEYLSLTGTCVTDCPSGSYKFALSHKCVNSCPRNYNINEEENECVFYTNIISNETNEQLVSRFIATNVTFLSIVTYEHIKVYLSTEKMTPAEHIEKRIPVVDISNCTTQLKGQNGISNEEELIILTKEKDNDINEANDENNNFFGKYNQLEVYDSSGRELNLSQCNSEIKISTYIGDIVEEAGLDIEEAKTLAEWGIDIYNPTHEFFNNICYEFESSDGKDITLEDRRKDIFQNVTFCQEGCSYGGFDYDLMIVSCICYPETLQSEPQNTTNEEHPKQNKFKELVKSFIANWLDFNIDVIYCYNLVFNGRIIKSNYGFLSMMCMFALQLIFLVIFLIKRLNPVKAYMKNFSKKEKKSEQAPPKKEHKSHKNDKEDKKNKHHRIKNKRQKRKTHKNYKVNKLSMEQSELSEQNLKDKYERKNKLKVNSMVPVIFKHKTNIKKDDIYKGKLSSDKKLNDIEEIKIKIKLNKKNKEVSEELKNTAIDIQDSDNQDRFTFKLSQRDEDLQEMNYQEAIIEERRSFFRIYWCFLVDSQTILGTFFTENYLDLLIIKLSFLVCNFQISFFLNALFYTDEYISEAYYNAGILDFFTGLPKAIYSFVATLITTNLLRMLSTSKSELLQIIREKKNKKDYLKQIKKKLKKLRCKLIFYYFFLFSLGLLFFYYVAAFCAVYRNSQKYWFIGCFESFIMDLLGAIIICLLLTLFRFIAIRQKVKCLYVFGNIINTFL